MKIIIVGCGRIGSELARELDRSRHAVTIIDPQPASFRRLGAGFKGNTIAGLGFDKDVLQKAGISRADAIAAFTSQDEANTVIARLAREIYRVPKVIAGLHDPLKASIYRTLGVQTVSATQWSVARAMDMLSHSDFETVLDIGDGEVTLLRVDIPSLLDGHAVREISLPGETLVVSITREGHAFLPVSGTVLCRDDEILVAVTHSAITHFRHILGMPRQDKERRR